MKVEKEYKFLLKPGCDIKHIKQISIANVARPSYQAFTDYNINYNETKGFFDIEQGYLMFDGDKVLRVRRSGDKRSRGVLCYKRFKSTSERLEYEISLSPTDTSSLLSECNLSLKKKRREIYSTIYKLDIDLYPDGLVVIELELYQTFTNYWLTYIWSDEPEPKTDQEIITFFQNKLSFLGDYIGDDPKYSNIEIAKKQSSGRFENKEISI